MAQPTLPAALERVRRANNTVQTLTRDYGYARSARADASERNDVQGVVASSRKACATFAALQEAEEELNTARWEAVDAGHTFAELDELQQRWKHT